MRAYNAKNVAYYTVLNIAGKVLPMMAALVGIPVLIGGIGTELFGILVIVWVFVGYSSLLDLGLPRGIIKVLSDYADRDETDRIHIVNTSLTLLVLAGILSGIVFVLIADPLVTRWLTIPPGYHDDARWSIFIIAVSYPFLITLSGLRAVLESHQQFMAINKLNVVYGSLNYLLPAGLVLVTPSLVYVVLVTVMVRLLNVVHLAAHVVRLFPARQVRFALVRDKIGPLFSYSRWIVLATVFAMLTAVADRFMIGSMISMTATTYYSTPLEMLMKLEVIPMSFIAVLFPAFTLVTARRQEGTENIYNLALKVMALLFALLCYFLIMGSDLLLTLWLGAEFSANAALVFRILCIGVYLLSVVYIAQTMVQGVGRPELSVLVYTLLMLLGLPATYLLIDAWAIEGAALARVLRIAFELAMISVVIRFTLRIHLQFRTIIVVLGGLMLTLAGMLIELSWLAFGLSVAGTVLVIVLFWQFGITRDEQLSLRKAVPAGLLQRFNL